MRERFERFDKYMKYSGLNDNRVTVECGLSQGLLGQARKGKSDLGAQTIEKILNKYQDLNKVWLLTGEGEMLKGETETSENYGFEDMDEDVPKKFISYQVPIAAMGGSLVGFEEDGVMKENCERVISPIANIDLVVPVCGESMEPEYPNGSKVYVRRINPEDFIAWGNVFVLDTTNGIVIKVVVESEREDCVRCLSLNPSGRYAPFDVPKRAIRAMYRVMLCMSVK